MDGAEIIVHCAGSSTGDEDKARNLVQAASQAGAPHVVYVSVVGADRIPVVSRLDRAMFGYFAARWFVCSEALANVIKHSGASHALVRAARQDMYRP